MQEGTTLKITNINNMWDKEIYHEDGNAFSPKKWFKEHDVVTLKSSSELSNEYVICITIDGVVCESQNFPIAEINSFCEPIGRVIKSTTSGAGATSLR